MVVRKYSTRRLYDTEESRYINLDELAARLRDGRKITVVDAKTNEDLTHQVMVQLLTESRSALELIPQSVLERLLQLDRAELAEFFRSWLGWALDAREGKRQAPKIQPVAPPAPKQVSVDQETLAQLLTMAGLQPAQHEAPPSPDEWADSSTTAASGVRVREGATGKDEVAALRAELDELKALLRGRKHG